MSVDITQYNPHIVLNGNQTQTWWFTHSDFDTSHSVVPAISIAQSDSIQWDDDWGGVWGPDTSVKIVTNWVEHDPSPVDYYGNPVGGWRSYDNRILVQFQNTSPNVARISIRFIIFNNS